MMSFFRAQIHLKNSIAYASQGPLDSTIITDMDGCETSISVPLNQIRPYFNNTDYHILSKHFIVHIDAIVGMENHEHSITITIHPLLKIRFTIPPKQVISFRHWMYSHYKK